MKVQHTDNRFLTSFNSLAIESQLYRLPASTILYFNDDCYIGRRLAPSDVASLLLGPTLRFDWYNFWMEAVSDEEYAQLTERHKHGTYTIKFIGTLYISSFPAVADCRDTVYLMT